MKNNSWKFAGIEIAELEIAELEIQIVLPKKYQGIEIVLPKKYQGIEIVLPKNSRKTVPIRSSMTHRQSSPHRESTFNQVVFLKKIKKVSVYYDMLVNVH